MRILSRVLLGVGAFIALLAVVVFFLLNYWLTPYINTHKPELEELISSRLGAVVRIGDIKASRRGFVPQLELSDIQVQTNNGENGLYIKKVHAAISNSSLLMLKLRFADFQVQEPRINIKRDAHGNFWVAGIDVSSLTSKKPQGEASKGIPPFLLWLVRQHKIVVSQGQAQWEDQLKQSPPLELSNINAVLTSSGRAHQIQIHATPPKEWGEPFHIITTLTEPLVLSASQAENWSAQAQTSFPKVDIKDLPHHIELPIQLVKGYGAVYAQANYENGKLVSSQVQLDIPEVEAVAESSLAPIHLQNFKGLLSATWEKNSLHVKAEDLTFKYPAQTQSDGTLLPEQIWAANPLEMSWTLNDEGGLDGGQLNVGNIDLALLSRFAVGLPLPSAIQKVLLEINAQGQIDSLTAQWSGPPKAPNAYSFTGTVSNLQARPSLAPTVPKGKVMAMGRPGVDGLHLKFEVSEKKGEAQISITDGSVSLPGLYNQETVAVKSLNATLFLTHLENGQFKIHTPLIELETPDAKLTADISWVSPNPHNDKDTAGYFTMNGRLTEAQISAVPRYLPNSIRTQARAYLSAALISGTVANATVKIEGPLADLPYHRQETGIFLIEGDAKNATYDFAPPVIQPKNQAPWPVLTNINGHIQFTGKGMLISNATGQIAGAPQSQFHSKKIAIPNWSIQDTHVLVSANIMGNANQILSAVNRSAIGKNMLNDMLNQAQVSGNISTEIDLDIMLDRMKDTSVKGNIQLTNNTISLWPFAPVFKHIKSQLTFTEKGFSAEDIQASTLGGTVQGHARLRVRQGLDIDLKGNLTAEGLFSDANLSKNLIPELNWLEGKTDYTFKAQHQGGQQTMQFESSLQGLALHLPAPLNKTIDDAYPVQVMLKPIPTDGQFFPMAMHIQTPASHASLPRIQAHYLLDGGKQGVSITQGAIGINESPAMPLTGTLAQVRLQKLNIPSWQKFLSGIPPSKKGSGSDSIKTSSSNLTLPSWWPNQTNAKIDRLEIGETFIAQDTQLKINRKGLDWRSEITAKEVAGHIRWQASSKASAPGELHINLSKLLIPEPDTTKDSDASSNTVKKASPPPAYVLLPNTSLNIKHLQLGTKILGTLQLKGNIDGNVTPARWRISALNITNQGSTLTGQGYWSNTAIPTTSIEFSVNTPNAGVLLQQLGHEKVISDATGQMNGKLSWHDLPFSFDIPSLSGDLFLVLEKGEVLFAEPGAGRLVSVLSLQSLPRRLSLDFRDLVKDGLAFDRIDGVFALDKGQMNIKALALDGASAYVNISGQIDLIQQTQKLQVKLTPALDMIAVSVALTAINPVAGISTLVAQMALREPLKKATTRMYYINGGWSDPEISHEELRTTDPKGKVLIKQIPS